MAEIRHLYNPIDDIHYTNGGYIHPSHPLPEENWQWLAGPAPQGAELYNPPSLAQQVDALVKTLSLPVQALQYSILSSLIQATLAGDIAVAQTMIHSILIPQSQSPEETDVYATMANLLQSAA